MLYGYIYGFFYLMFENAVDCYDDDISQSLKSTTSTNAGYIQKLIQLNQERAAGKGAIRSQEDEEEKIDAVNSHL